MNVGQPPPAVTGLDSRGRLSHMGKVAQFILARALSSLGVGAIQTIAWKSRWVAPTLQTIHREGAKSAKRGAEAAQATNKITKIESKQPRLNIPIGPIGRIGRFKGGRSCVTNCENSCGASP